MKIIFVCKELYERPAKLAKLLNSKGISVVLLYERTTQHEFLEKFQEKYRINKNDLKIFLNDNRNIFVHYFSKGVDNFSQIILESKIKFAYDYKDVFENIVSLKISEKFKSTQRNLILSAHFITYRDFTIFDYFRRNFISRNTNLIFLPDMITDLKVFSEKLDDISVCFGGNFALEKIEPSYAGMGQLYVIQNIIAQDMSYHFFPYRHDGKDQNFEAMSDYHMLKNQPNFYIYDRLHHEKYIKKIARYSFGSIIHPCFHSKELEKLHSFVFPYNAIPSRILDYISAGLPIITDSQLKGISNYIKKYEIGIVLNPGELHNIRNIIEKVDRYQLSKNSLEHKKFLLENYLLLNNLINEYEKIFKNLKKYYFFSKSLYIKSKVKDFIYIIKSQF